MRSFVLKTWGKNVAQAVGAAVHNEVTYPQVGLASGSAVYKLVSFYSFMSDVLLVIFHKAQSFFVSGTAVIIPITHTTNKSEHKPYKFTFYLIGA
jgi:hypothetical protein